VQEAVDGRTNGFSMRYRVAWQPDKPTTWRWIHSRGRVTERDRQGRATRLLGIYEDVTDRVTQEENARRRDLQFAQATRLAALGEMATAMAHEINQPLGALSAYIQTAALLLKKPASSRQDLLAIIERARMQVERTAEIVRRLRALYQGRGTVDQRVDMCAIVRSAVAMLQADMAAQGVRLVLALGTKPVLAIGDELQIEQVLYNLLRNAVEALREVRGARRMTVSVIRLPRLARVVVSDNGPGIPASLRARVFEPFVTTKHDGTGLGLSISRTIVEAHGGSLRLDAATRKGTMFILDLPRSPRKCV
jgi:two-component system, LuxR family, sensor kinase FixL